MPQTTNDHREQHRDRFRAVCAARDPSGGRPVAEQIDDRSVRLASQTWAMAHASTRPIGHQHEGRVLQPAPAEQQAEQHAEKRQ